MRTPALFLALVFSLSGCAAASTPEPAPVAPVAPVAAEPVSKQELVNWGYQVMQWVADYGAYTLERDNVDGVMGNALEDPTFCSWRPMYIDRTYAEVLAAAPDDESRALFDEMLEAYAVRVEECFSNPSYDLTDEELTRRLSRPFPEDAFRDAMARRGVALPDKFQFNYKRPLKPPVVAG